MKNTVGVGELRENLSRYLRRVERGERLVVMDQNRRLAELGLSFLNRRRTRLSPPPPWAAPSLSGSAATRAL
jgi:hypothetical protein